MKHNARQFLENKFKVKAVMVDLDGTLIDTAPEIALAANAMLDALNLSSLPVAKIQTFIGDGAAKLVERCMTETLREAPNANLLLEAQTLFFAHYADVVSISQPYPQAEQGLQQLKKIGLPLACITNKPAKFTVPLLQATGLIDYFDLVVSGDTLPKKKPEPDQIFHICKQFGMEPWEALLIGDSNTDILAAKNAGCYVFTVPYGYNQGLAIDHGSVDAMIEHLADTLNYLNH